MKILLLGEFSGVHNNLKKGLHELGHQVTLANNGDSFKKFSQDLHISPFNGRYFGKIFNVLYFFFNIRMFVGYDIVQFINPFALPYYYRFFGISNIVFKFNKKVVYYACGTDPAYISIKEKLDYFPFNDEEIIKKQNGYNRFDMRASYNSFLQNIDKIIPSSYSYALGYWNNKKLCKPIPLPASGHYAAETKPAAAKRKILFGVTRKGFKGADYIIQALNRIKKSHPDKVEITIVERLPFAEYKKKLQDCDILIDQCKSYGYGMNALFAMEQGVIVLSGSEKETLKYSNLENCPVINITPCVKQIEEEITRLINYSEIDLCKLKKLSLDYAKHTHGLQIITNLFVAEYCK